MSVSYEWTVELINDHSGDIEESDFFLCYSDAMETAAKWADPENKGIHIDIGLVRDQFDRYDAMVDRVWAYVKGGKLPEFLETSNGGVANRVPKKYRAEVERYHAQVGNGKSVIL